MAEPTPHVVRPGRSENTAISTADLPDDQYVSNKAQAEAAVEAAKAKVTKAQAHLDSANAALAAAESELAGTE